MSADLTETGIKRERVASGLRASGLVPGDLIGDVILADVLCDVVDEDRVVDIVVREHGFEVVDRIGCDENLDLLTEVSCDLQEIKVRMTLVRPNYRLLLFTVADDAQPLHSEKSFANIFFSYKTIIREKSTGFQGRRTVIAINP